jgi:uroporphyrin-III C-methyltransferase
LAGLGEAAQSCTTPAIIVIGENVRLREGMDWLGAMGGKLLNPDPLDHSHFSKAG